jgi:HEPN domain-containing protein
MIAVGDLRRIAQARLKDAEVLQRARRYDGAVYVCGYAVEIALKARICRALRWGGYPSTRSDFERYQSFRTHNLDVLLHLSGRETRVKAGNLNEWSIVAVWDPNTRYGKIGWASHRDAATMIAATKTLLAAV